MVAWWWLLVAGGAGLVLGALVPWLCVVVLDVMARREASRIEREQHARFNRGRVHTVDRWED